MPGTAPSGQRILLVDDEPRIREVVATYLRRDVDTWSRPQRTAKPPGWGWPGSIPIS
jgi:hypothetical protein